MKPRFEYDPEKSRRNQEKHGMPLAEAEALWNVDHVVIPARTVGEEIRYTMIGMIHNRFHMAVFTRRRGIIRLITYHQADRRLQRIYERIIYEKEKS